MADVAAGCPEIRITAEELPELHGMLQSGVLVEATLGASIFEVLSQDLGLSQQQLERVQTVFHNSHPVDELESIVVQADDVVALSAAMPGLMGAVMRRSGFYARLRESISARREECAQQPDACGQGLIRLKVFNLLLTELVPTIMAKGLYAEATELKRALPGKALPEQGLVRVRLSDAA